MHRAVGCYFMNRPDPNPSLVELDHFLLGQKQTGYARLTLALTLKLNLTFIYTL